MLFPKVIDKLLVVIGSSSFFFLLISLSWDWYIQSVWYVMDDDGEALICAATGLHMVFVNKSANIVGIYDFLILAVYGIPIVAVMM